MRRVANFNNTIAEILRKSRRKEREMKRWEGEREKNNFGIGVAKIPKKEKKTLTSISVIVLPKYFPHGPIYLLVSFSNCKFLFEKKGVSFNF